MTRCHVGRPARANGPGRPVSFRASQEDAAALARLASGGTISGALRVLIQVGEALAPIAAARGVSVAELAGELAASLDDGTRELADLGREVLAVAERRAASRIAELALRERP